MGSKRSRSNGIGLIATMTTAVVVLIGSTSGLLLLDPRTTGADALRTGGFAAGSVVALYALWLNDRRRRVEEQRQELDRRRQQLDSERYELEQRRQDLEDRRTQHDRDRVADERFARAVELLGSEADQVRVGAMHALAGLAKTTPDYTQTVLDVLCAYLRRPFLHPRYAVPSGRAERPEWRANHEWTAAEVDHADRKLQVRLTAQRLIAELLPRATETDSPAFDLDLTRATLEYLDLSGRRIGTLVLRYMHLYSSTNFSGCEILGPAWFTGTRTASGTLSGNFRCAGTTFHQRAWFSGVEFNGPTYFDRTHFTGRTKFSGCTFADRVSMVDAHFADEIDFRDTEFRSDADLGSITCDREPGTEGITVNSAAAVTLPEGWKSAIDARISLP